MNLKSIFNQVTPIEEEAWIDFEQYFSIKTLRKRDVLWQAGEVCKHLVFINKGLIRSCRFIEEKEISTNFFFEDTVFYDDYSFISGQPCADSYEALEQTELIVIPKAAVNQMFDKYRSFERLGRKMVEHNHAKQLEELQNSRNLPSKERYLQLLSVRPDIANRVPLKHIASYLNMTPEYLSKLRKDIAS
jgi:CRP-like cAMP-binding protein